MTKYLLLLGLCALLLSSCATVDYAALESRVAALEKKKATTTMLLAEQAGARKFWWRNALTEGTDALDAISHTILADGDAAFVMTKDGTTMGSWLYVYDEDATDPEDGTNYTIIAPDSGGGRWYLVNFNGASIITRAADGTHYFQAVNTVAFSGTPAEGMCYWKDTASNENDLCCYDADASTWRCHSFD